MYLFEGRPQFQQMLQDIENDKDNIDFVLVFKLSRFGINTADVLSSLQRIQDFGVNLICVEDGIDSYKTPMPYTLRQHHKYIPHGSFVKWMRTYSKLYGACTNHTVNM